MKKLDFIYFDAGGGHRAAANALRQAIEQQQRPFGVRSELAAAFRIPETQVRVIMPDTGSGYGGRARTNGRPGGNDPTGNLADRSPALSCSAASRKAARNRPYISRSALRTALLAQKR